ncbi:MAG: chorismate synthase [Desulfurispora sp.]|uniref:chorismate synthase n=1 Tax=Desulfurispora sp. TaxID=3014275 RepID=UPI00404A5A98
MLRFLTAGESHGPALLVIVEGLPAGLPLATDYINRFLTRRQHGFGRGGRMNIEQDTITILAGVRGGRTLGSPLALQIANRDHSNWAAIMSPAPDADLDSRRVTAPRPGHADLAGALKYGHSDLRNVLERASARETAARVAAGALAAALLEELGIQIAGQVTGIGPVSISPLLLPPPELRRKVQTSALFCADPGAEKAMIQAIEQAREQGDTLGGTFAITVSGLPPGLGSYVHYDRRLDGILAAALMSIPAIKGVEIGAGFNAARLPGSQVHDEIFYTPERGFYRRTNHAGGLEGGMTNGEPLLLQAAMKPIPTLMRPLRSVEFSTGEPVAASRERSDVCAVPAACVVGEAAVAWEIARVVLEQTGGDTWEEITARFAGYRRRTGERNQL